MIRLGATAAAGVIALSAATQAAAQSVAAIDVRAAPLPRALQSLARQTGVELLYDLALVKDHTAPAVRGALTPEAAMRQLVSGSNLVVRRTASGVLVLQAPAAPPLAQPDVEVSELLVIGRRTQNADIRRMKDDVQPYQIATGEQVRSAHRDNIDQYFNSRVTQTTQAFPPGLGVTGLANSQIDLRDLGSGGTLVLVDGRRLPSMPETSIALDPALGLFQPDLNALAPHAIARIETLTGTAGGIHGFGALGGVVNVVLDRETRGLDLHVTKGITSRGDAERRAVEASFGYTSKDGSSDIAVFASRTTAEPLLTGDRDFMSRDRRLSSIFAPPGTDIAENVAGIHFGNSLTVRVSPGSRLVLKPAYGGGALSTNYTFLPADFSGSPLDLGAMLAANAGRSDVSLTEGEAAGALGSTTPQTSSLLLNARHRFSSGLEVYADAVVLDTRSEYQGRYAFGTAFMAGSSAKNPFVGVVQLTFPVPGMRTSMAHHMTIKRYTAGLIADLPHDWRAALDASVGSFRNAYSREELSFSGSGLFFFGGSFDPPLAPFGDWRTFQDGLAAMTSRDRLVSIRRNEFQAQSLRLAGPVFQLDGGPTTLTLLAERRREHVPASVDLQTAELGDFSFNLDQPVAESSSATTSFYAELRAPVFGPAALLTVLNDLELQLALRRDDRRDRYSFNVRSEAPEDRRKTNFGVTAYTAGAKVHPRPWLMLRASYATGEEPPPLENFNGSETEFPSLPIGDPKRGGTDLGRVTIRFLGRDDLPNLRATTLSLGAVLKPLGQDRLRLAVDYSRIRRSRDVDDLSFPDILAGEDQWPERVVRGPLTEADRAAGYTGGPVTFLDRTYFAARRHEVETVDLQAEWPVRLADGHLRFYAYATHVLRSVQTGLNDPVVREGSLDGPLKWRANGGAEWRGDRLTLGANLQYYGSYSIRMNGRSRDDPPTTVEIMQGADEIPSQAYLDLYASWRVPLRERGFWADVAIDLGVINVFDRAPPRVVEELWEGPEYSQYGDPRRRRFQLVLSTRF